MLLILNRIIKSKGINPLVLFLAFCLFSLNANSQKLKDAEKLLNKKKYSEAKVVINEILSDSNNYFKFEPHFLKGEIYLTEFQEIINLYNYDSANIRLLDTAFVAFSIAQNLADTNSVPFELLLGIQNCGIHYNNKGIEEYKANNLDTAIYYIEKSIAIDADRNKIDTNKFTNCFAISIKTANLKKANYYGTILTDSLQVNNANLFGTLIQLNINNNNEKVADSILNVAIAKNPSDKNFQSLRINLAINEKDLAESARELVKLYEKDTANSYLSNTIANLYLKMGNSRSASLYFKKTIELDTTNFSANFNLGSIYYNEAVKLNNSFENINTVTEIELKEVELLLNQALPYFKTAHNLKYNDKETMQSLKLIYSKLGGYDIELNQIEDLLNN